MGGRGATSATALSPERQYARDVSEALIRNAERAEHGTNNVRNREYAATARDAAELVESGRGRELAYDRDFAALRRIAEDVYGEASGYSARSDLSELMGEGLRGRPMHLDEAEWGAARTAAQAEWRKLRDKGYTAAEVAAVLGFYGLMRRKR